MGDLYGRQQGARVTALSQLPGHPIIQMPQSIHFRDSANAEAFAELCRQHGNFTLMVRERNSQTIAQEVLGIEPILSPDHAIANGRPLRSHTQPVAEVLWLARRPGDPEYVDVWEPDVSQDNRVKRVEWLEGVPEHEKTWDLPGRVALAINQHFRDNWQPDFTWAPLAHQLVAATYDPLAHRWVNRGYEILQSAKVVVTDKLHGHIMCVLAGIPHVVLDNSYGKVSGTLDAWTGSLPGVNRASSGEEAWEIAQQLVAQVNS
jgi:pyruvyl transferase EpsO